MLYNARLGESKLMLYNARLSHTTSFWFESMSNDVKLQKDIVRFSYGESVLENRVTDRLSSGSTFALVGQQSAK